MKKIILIIILFACVCKPFKSLSQKANINDSLALVDLYNKDGGEHWRNDYFWHTKRPLNNWEGVYLDSNGRVTTLFLSGFGLVGDIPASFGSLSQLFNLNLSSNPGITSFPNSSSQLKNLLYFTYQYNRTIPAGIFLISSLKELYLDDDSIGKLPDEVGNLTNLTLLSISNAHVSELPASFGNLINLNTLFLGSSRTAPYNIGGNDLQTLPASFGNLKSLQLLLLDHNNLQLLPSSFGGLKSLETLDLDNNKLQTLPGSFGNLKSLQSAIFSYNNIKFLPPSFGKLDSLTYLAFDNNALDSLPAAMVDLKKLISLYLDYNNLKTLPVGLSGIDSLSIISINYNKFERFPVALKDCKYLYELDARGNFISTIPPFFETISNLETLNIGANDFITIPKIITRLFHKKLSYVFMDENFLGGAIPAYFKSVPAHVEVRVSMNYYTFDAGESLIDRGVFNRKGFDFVPISFGPQANLRIDQQGNALSIYAGGTLSHNTYTWYKIVSPTQDSFIVIKGDSTFKPASEGRYSVYIDNSVATQLRLRGDTVNFVMSSKQALANNLKEANESVANNNFTIYPSPAKSTVSIDLNLSTLNNMPASLQIINAEGKLMEENSLQQSKGSTVSIDVSKLAAGIYYVVIKTKESTLSGKFVKE